MQKILHKFSFDTLFLLAFCALFVLAAGFLAARHDVLLTKGTEGLVTAAFQDPRDTTNDTILLTNHGAIPVTVTLVFFPIATEGQAQEIEQQIWLTPYEEKSIRSTQGKSEQLKKIEVHFTTNNQLHVLTLYRK
jgi:hypothetical protein